MKTHFALLVLPWSTNVSTDRWEWKSQRTRPNLQEYLANVTRKSFWLRRLFRQFCVLSTTMFDENMGVVYLVNGSKTTISDKYKWVEIVEKILILDTAQEPKDVKVLSVSKTLEMNSYTNVFQWKWFTSESNSSEARSGLYVRNISNKRKRFLPVSSSSCSVHFLFFPR